MLTDKANEGEKSSVFSLSYHYFILSVSVENMFSLIKNIEPDKEHRSREHSSAVFSGSLISAVVLSIFLPAFKLRMADLTLWLKTFIIVVWLTSQPDYQYILPNFGSIHSLWLQESGSYLFDVGAAGKHSATICSRVV